MSREPGFKCVRRSPHPPARATAVVELYRSCGSGRVKCPSSWHLVLLAIVRDFPLARPMDMPSAGFPDGVT